MIESRGLRFHRQGFALLGVLVGALLTGWPSASAAEKLLADQIIVVPIKESDRPGAFVPLGASVVKADEELGAVNAEDPAGNVGFVRWFPNHMPLDTKQISQPDWRLSVIAKGTAAMPVKASWRLAGQNDFGPEIEGSLQPQKDGLVSALLPVPPVPEGKQANGLKLTFPSAKIVLVSRAALVVPADMLLEVAGPDEPWSGAPVKVSGRGATPGQSITLTFKPDQNPSAKVETLEVAADGSGRFTAVIKPGQFVAGDYAVAARETKSGRFSLPTKLFLFPLLTTEKLPPVKRAGANLEVNGKLFAFVGVNYAPFLLDFPREPDFKMIVRNVLEMQRWGVKVARVPVHFGMIQPAEGVFPDNPKWADTLRSHNLNPLLLKQLDFFFQFAGQCGIYSILDWHGMPTDPYYYASGGQPADKAAGKPGEGLSWLSPSKSEIVEFQPGNERHLKALLDTHTWMAAHVKGNSNFLGFEVPYNEPHDRYMAVEINWRRVTDLCVAAVHKGDPDRMTFTMPSAYGHDNLSPSATWLPVDRATGGGPHFYLANGPVPARPDAMQYREPYLAREPTPSFAHAQASVFMPFSGTDYPIYNGEMGEYGNENFLPHEKFPDRAEWEIENQIVQAYAAGWAGALEWTLWNNPKDFMPYREIYERVLKRFAPVMAAGPIDRTKAEVAFVQSPSAVPPQNGMNYACVPLTKLALAVHLPLVNYYTDQQFLYSFRAGIPTGLEQVVEGVSLDRYKALVVDRRFMDGRAIALAQSGDRPILWTDDAEKITPKEFAAFLTKAGVKVDTRTPEGLQVIEGPEHLLIYSRYNQSFSTRAYPVVKREGRFKLVGEDGKVAFEGDATTLADKGIPISLPRWRTAIYRFSR